MEELFRHEDVKVAYLNVAGNIEKYYLKSLKKKVKRSKIKCFDFFKV